MHGGVMFSGGEPALHSDFICALLEKLKEHDFNLALDTCGQAPVSAYTRICRS